MEIGTRGPIRQSRSRGVDAPEGREPIGLDRRNGTCYPRHWVSGRNPPRCKPRGGVIRFSRPSFVILARRPDFRIPLHLSRPPSRRRGCRVLIRDWSAVSPSRHRSPPPVGFVVLAPPPTGPGPVQSITSNRKDDARVCLSRRSSRGLWAAVFGETICIDPGTHQVFLPGLAR